MGEAELSAEEKSSGQNMNKVYVVAEDCTACSLCYETLPEVFTDRGDGISFVSTPDAASQEQIQQSIDECPGQCIIWGPEDDPNK